MDHDDPRQPGDIGDWLTVDANTTGTEADAAAVLLEAFAEKL